MFLLFCKQIRPQRNFPAGVFYFMGSGEGCFSEVLLSACSCASARRIPITAARIRRTSSSHQGQPFSCFSCSWTGTGVGVCVGSAVGIAAGDEVGKSVAEGGGGRCCAARTKGSSRSRAGRWLSRWQRHRYSGGFGGRFCFFLRYRFWGGSRLRRCRGLRIAAHIHSAVS